MLTEIYAALFIYRVRGSSHSDSPKAGPPTLLQLTSPIKLEVISNSYYLSECILNSFLEFRDSLEILLSAMLQSKQVFRVRFI